METIREKIERMRKEGFIQLSRKYRLVGNLPEGKTGIEMIREVDPYMAKHFQEHFDEQMKEHFLRVYALNTEHQVELSEAEFAEWLRQRKDVWQLKQDAKEE